MELQKKYTMPGKTYKQTNKTKPREIILRSGRMIRVHGLSYDRRDLITAITALTA